jgi:ribosomal protein S6--L-glutamate ligase
MQKKIVIGWQEWCVLPELGLPAIKAKMDTGARTSSLHALEIEPFRQGGKKHVRFVIHPLRYFPQVARVCEAAVVDERVVTNSGGEKEKRYVIYTPIVLADETFNIEMTLTNRAPMLFRMLLGRQALKKRFIVDVSERMTLMRASSKTMYRRFYSALS